MKSVKIIGVPEHFNLPWHMALDDGAFKDRGISLEWTDVPEGTGKMAQMLQDGEADLAVILSEGIVKSIIDGNPSKIVQTYVQSPLLWGIHTSGNSDIKHISELEGKVIAISRFGSGSHLMAYIHAAQQGWDITALKFKIVHTLEGAVTALTQGEADYFMWEHFTTQPLVTDGTFLRIGDFPTPWPCFVLAGNSVFIKENNALLNHVLEVINNYTYDFKRIPSIDKTISNRYSIALESVQQWLSITEWSEEQLPTTVVETIQNSLHTLDLIPEKKSADTILL